jgi:hypothetical protein
VAWKITRLAKNALKTQRVWSIPEYRQNITQYVIPIYNIPKIPEYPVSVSEAVKSQLVCDLGL